MPLVLDGTNGVSGVDGTASNPAIEGTDSNTGIFYPSADTVAIGTGGTEALRVNSSQNVGIGTSSPSFRLHSVATSAVGLYVNRLTTDGDIAKFAVGNTDSFVFHTDTALRNLKVPGAVSLAFWTNDTERMRIDSSGNVGIGTTSPGKRLGVTETNNTAVSSATFWDSNYGGIILRNPSDTTNSVTGIGFIGGSTANAAAGIGAILESTQLSALAFFTGGQGRSNSVPERARIDSSGNMMWNGTNTTTGNGNVGYAYKFFGAANNIIIPMESSGTNRYAILEYRRTGRASARTSQISIGENASNQGEILCYSSAANSDVSGGVSLSNGATAWASASDIRLKTVTGTYTNALQDITQIEPIKFIWKHDQSNTPQVGVSAQSVENIVPEAITRSKNIATHDDETEYLSVRYTELIPLMIASIQELNAKVEALEAQLKGNA